MIEIIKNKHHIHDRVYATEGRGAVIPTTFHELVSVDTFDRDPVYEYFNRNHLKFDDG